jgi:hypothetical protein
LIISLLSRIHLLMAEVRYSHPLFGDYIKNHIP